MEGGLRFNTSGGGSMQIASTDAGLANFGELTAYPSPVNTSADTATYGASFVCASNVAPEGSATQGPLTSVVCCCCDQAVRQSLGES